MNKLPLRVRFLRLFARLAALFSLALAPLAAAPLAGCTAAQAAQGGAIAATAAKAVVHAELPAGLEWIGALTDSALDLLVSRLRGASPQSAPVAEAPATTRAERELLLAHLLGAPKAG